MRNIFHAVISILMWCLFGYYWYVVGQRQITGSSLQAVGILALITLVGLILTLWWIAHNKQLASRNRRSKAPKTPDETFATDHLNRTLVSPGLAVLKEAATVVVSLNEEEQKVYTVATGLGD